MSRNTIITRHKQALPWRLFSLVNENRKLHVALSLNVSHQSSQTLTYLKRICKSKRAGPTFKDIGKDSYASNVPYQHR